MVLDLLDVAGVLGEDEVDGSSLSSEATGSSNSVDVVLLLERKLVVDDESNLLHINSSSEEISGDEHTYGSGSELLHDDVSLELVHFSVHDGDGEVVFGHGLFKFFDSLLGVTVNKSLVDVKVGIQIEQNLHLPLLLLDSDVVLVNTFESELLVLDENLGGVAHEMLGELQNLIGESCGEKSNLDVSGEVLEDVLDLDLETAGQHLISFVEHEELEMV